jgi:hypothetical protein
MQGSAKLPLKTKEELRWQKRKQEDQRKRNKSNLDLNILFFLLFF